MEPVDWLGAFAGTLTTLSFLPQVWKIWTSRSAGDISFGMFALLGVGGTAWLIYGFLIRATPIILANLVTLVLVLAIIIMKLVFDRRIKPQVRRR